MNLLLDTNAFLWMSLDSPRLSETAREVMSDTDNDLYISAVSYWEIAIKVSIGKYSLTESLDDFVGREIVTNRLIPLAIDIDHAARVSTLPFHHRDPFDRMLIAQSVVEGFPIMGSDSVFDQYGVARIW